jgi:hypothetical protein
MRLMRDLSVHPSPIANTKTHHQPCSRTHTSTERELIRMCSHTGRSSVCTNAAASCGGARAEHRRPIGSQASRRHRTSCAPIRPLPEVRAPVCAGTTGTMCSANSWMSHACLAYRAAFAGNRWRRHQLPAELRGEIYPKNILMVGPTGCAAIAPRPRQERATPHESIRSCTRLPA